MTENYRAVERRAHPAVEHGDLDRAPGNDPVVSDGLGARIEAVGVRRDLQADRHTESRHSVHVEQHASDRCFEPVPAVLDVRGVYDRVVVSDDVFGQVSPKR